MQIDRDASPAWAMGRGAADQTATVVVVVDDDDDVILTIARCESSRQALPAAGHAIQASTHSLVAVYQASAQSIPLAGAVIFSWRWAVGRLIPTLPRNLTRQLHID
jgi:hypothetical protein